MLLVLMAILVTGLPQVATALSDGSLRDEDHTLRPVRRALHLDKEVTGRFVLPPLPRPTGPAVVATIEPSAVFDAPGSHALLAPPRTRPWLRGLVLILYRHHSNYT